MQLDAQFAGFAQILVYIGAVAILIVFAILLTRGSDLPKDGVFSRTWAVGLVIAAAVFAVLAWAVLQSVRAVPQQTAVPAVTVHDIGNALVGRYVLPLEIVGLLLTAATIGAVIVAMHEKERPKSCRPRLSPVIFSLRLCSSPSVSPVRWCAATPFSCSSALSSC